MKEKSLSSFFVRSDLYQLLPNSHRIGGVGCGITVMVNDDPSGETILTTDLVSILALYDWNFRCIILLLFLYNNKDKFTRDMFNDFIQDSCFHDDEYMYSVYDMSKEKFIYALSDIMSSALDHYKEVPEFEVYDKLESCNIHPPNLLRSDEGVKIIYTYYMRVFLYTLYEYNEEIGGMNIKDEVSKMFRLNDCINVEMVMEVLNERSDEKLDLDIDPKDESNVLVDYFTYKLFVSMIIMFHNAIYELLETNKYPNSQFLKDYFSTFELKNAPVEDIMHTLIDIMLNETDGYKYITKISLDVEDLAKKSMNSVTNFT